nr:hypothetical protein [Pseudomonas uvaldensis]
MFRLGRDVEAGLAMVVLVESAQLLVENMTSDIHSSWHELLTLMINDQIAQNWLSLADYLDRELVDLLTGGARI